MEVEQVETSLSFSDLTSLILDIGKYHIGETGCFPFARDSMIMGKKGDCVIPQTLESNVTELHKFLYGEEGYQTTDLVKKISAKISADSGMYKKGVSVDHVPTDQGYVPKETKETDETKKTTKESDEIDERESTSEGTSIGWHEANETGRDHSGWYEADETRGNHGRRHETDQFDEAGRNHGRWHEANQSDETGRDDIGG